MNIRSKSVNINKSSSKSDLEVSLPEAVDVDKDIVYFTVKITVIILSNEFTVKQFFFILNGFLGGLFLMQKKL